MVQTVTLPFSQLNALPGVSGVEDVSFDIPELSDIIEAIEANTLDRTALDEALADALEDALSDVTEFGLDVQGLVDDIVQDVETALTDALDDLAEEVTDAIDNIDVPGLEDLDVEIDGSLFSLETDFVDILAEALSQADLVDVPQFPTLEEIEQIIEDATPDLDLDVQAELEEALMSILDDINIPTAEELADQLIQRLEDTVLDDGEAAEIEEAFRDLGRED